LGQLFLPTNDYGAKDRYLLHTLSVDVGQIWVIADEVCLGACFVVFVMQVVYDEPDKCKPYSLPVQAVPAQCQFHEVNE